MGQCIYHRGTYSMQTTTGLVSAVIKFSARMQRGKYQTLRRHSLLMHPHRDSTAVIRYGTGTVRFQDHLNPVTVPCQMLVHRVIHDLIDQMIQTLSRNTSYIHTRTFPDRFESFKHRDTAGVITVFLCHNTFLSILFLPLYLFFLSPVLSFGSSHRL